MILGPGADRSILRGTAAVQLWDAFTGRPLQAPCDVTAVRAADGTPVAQAERHHSAGLQGLLLLGAGDYRLQLVPRTGAYVPSLRSLKVLPGGPAVGVDALLRPGPAYSEVPRGAVVLRGTVQWGTPPGAPVPAPLPPGRWVLVSGRLQRTTGGGGVLATAWTRADARGDFVLMLVAPGPDTDGKRPAMNAVVEFHGTSPAATAPRLADDDYSDLVLDDGSDSDVLARQPVRHTETLLDVKPGQEKSLNTVTYTVQPAGPASARKQSVILLS